MDEKTQKTLSDAITDLIIVIDDLCIRAGYDSIDDAFDKIMKERYPDEKEVGAKVDDMKLPYSD